MTKLNNKGFMFVETIVVATILIVALMLIYEQFNKVYKSYTEKIKYNSVEAVYAANNMKRLINDNGLILFISRLDRIMDNKPYLDLTDCSISTGFNSTDMCNLIKDKSNIKKVIFTSNNLESVKDTNSYQNDFTESFKDYLYYLNKSESTVNGYRIVVMLNNGMFGTISAD